MPVCAARRMPQTSLAGTLLACQAAVGLCSLQDAAAALPSPLESDVSDHSQRVFYDRNVGGKSRCKRHAHPLL